MSVGAPLLLLTGAKFRTAVFVETAHLSTQWAQIAEEVLQHLSTLPGAEVEVRIEINVQVPNGIPDQAKRVVGENARSLKFDSSEFSD